MQSPTIYASSNRWLQVSLSIISIDEWWCSLYTTKLHKAAVLSSSTYRQWSTTLPELEIILNLFIQSYQNPKCQSGILNGWKVWFYETHVSYRRSSIFVLKVAVFLCCSWRFIQQTSAHYNRTRESLITSRIVDTIKVPLSLAMDLGLLIPPCHRAHIPISLAYTYIPDLVTFISLFMSPYPRSPQLYFWLEWLRGISVALIKISSVIICVKKFRWSLKADPDQHYDHSE